MTVSDARNKIKMAMIIGKVDDDAINDMHAAARAEAIEDCAELARNRADVVKFFGGVYAQMYALSEEIRKMI
jgi:hypothetical protein